MVLHFKVNKIEGQKGIGAVGFRHCSMMQQALCTETVPALAIQCHVTT